MPSLSDKLPTYSSTVQLPFRCSWREMLLDNMPEDKRPRNRYPRIRKKKINKK